MPAERRTVTGCVLLTGCCVASWSQTQASCALCRTIRHGKRGSGSFGVHASLVVQGFSKEPPVVWGDSLSALQLAHRQGTGRLKFVEVRLVAMQSWVSMGRLLLQKVLTAENVADVLNKACLTYYLGDTVCTVGFEIIRLRWLHHVELGHTWTLHSSCGPVGALSLRSSSRFILDWFVFCYLVHRTGSA